MFHICGIIWPTTEVVSKEWTSCCVLRSCSLHHRQLGFFSLFVLYLLLCLYFVCIRTFVFVCVDVLLSRILHFFSKSSNSKSLTAFVTANKTKDAGLTIDSSDELQVQCIRLLGTNTRQKIILIRDIHNTQTHY